MDTEAQAALSTEERRQLIYASLLRYAPETASLRDRILERMVIAALVGSSATTPFRVGKIQRAMILAPDAPLIRPEVIQVALTHLMESGKVLQIELLKRHAYYLSETAAAEIAAMVGSGQDLFHPVMDRMLVNTEHLVPRDTAEQICREFIAECFTRFGLQIAKTVAGQLTPDDLLKYADVKAAFAAAVDGKSLSLESVDSLKARCLQFLASKEPEDVRLKFHITQGYFFAQLIGFGDVKFELLTERAFDGTVLYLDTNVAILALLRNDRLAGQFDELLAVAGRLGIELRITRATVNEVRRVVADRIQQANKVFGALPDELIEMSNDQFIAGFIDARATDADLSPEQFFEPFEHVAEVLKESGVILVDIVEDELIKGRDFSALTKVLQDEALASRGFEKSEDILRHDIAHFALVGDERVSNELTWFLTRDRSLPIAATKLKGTSLHPFCYSLIGFLQSVSPFLIAGQEEQQIAGIFAALLEEQLLPHEQLFNMKELVLLVEMHQDVIATPKESLISAVDYVKSTVLRGRTYRVEHYAEVALGLRSFLASSGDEQRRELEAERTRLEFLSKQEQEAAAAERRLRLRAEETILAQMTELAELREQSSEQSSQIGLLTSELESTGLAIRKTLQSLLPAAPAIGLILLWRRVPVAGWFRATLPPLAGWIHFDLGVTVVGWSIALIPAIIYARRVSWPDQGRIGYIATLMMGAFALSGGYQSTPVFSIAATTGLVAAAVVLGFSTKRA